MQNITVNIDSTLINKTIEIANETATAAEQLMMFGMVVLGLTFLVCLPFIVVAGVKDYKEKTRLENR